MTGKPILDPGFAGDDGRADPRLAAALAAYAGEPAAEAALLAALAASRLLVPVIAIATETDSDADGRQQEKSTDMAVVTLLGIDGRRALPVFSSVETLARWRPEARPVPVQAARAAVSAYAEDAAVLVLDVAGPTTYVVDGRPLEALARGESLTPAYDDDRVTQAVASCVADEPAVSRAWLEPVAGADARLSLVIAGADPAIVATRVAARLRENDTVRATTLRGLEIVVVPDAGRPRAPQPTLADPGSPSRRSFRNG